MRRQLLLCACQIPAFIAFKRIEPIASDNVGSVRPGSRSSGYGPNESASVNGVSFNTSCSTRRIRARQERLAAFQIYGSSTEVCLQDPHHRALLHIPMPGASLQLVYRTA